MGKGGKGGKGGGDRMVWSSTGQRLRRPDPGEHTWACKVCGHGWNRHFWSTCQSCHKPASDAPPPKPPASQKGAGLKGGGARETVSPVAPRTWAGRPAAAAAASSDAAADGASAGQAHLKALVALGASGTLPENLLAMCKQQLDKGIDNKFEGKPNHVQLQRYQQMAASKQRKIDSHRQEVADTLAQLGGLTLRLQESREAVTLAERELEDIDKKIRACSQAAHLEVVAEQPEMAFDTLIPGELKGDKWDGLRKRLAEAAGLMASIQKEVKEAVKPPEAPTQQNENKAPGMVPAAAAADESVEPEPMDTDDDLLCGKLGEFAKLFSGAKPEGEEGQQDLIRRAEPFLEVLAPVFKRRKQL